MTYGKGLTKYAGSCGRYRGFYGNSLLDYSYPVMNGGGGDPHTQGGIYKLFYGTIVFLFPGAEAKRPSCHRVNA